MRADYALPRLLCPACRKSVDKANKPELAKQPAVKRRAAGLAAPAVSKRRRVRKTADGLLELDVKLPSLQDLCVRAIAKNIDQVESFGDVSEAVTLKLCRIISKMRLLDEQTLGLFLGAGRTTVTLYDCAKLTDHDLGRLLEYPNIESLHLGLCGRLTGGRLLDLANKLPNLTSLTLEGAFLVDDQAFADFFRIIGDRLRVFHVRWAGFGLTAMRALVVNCENLEDLSIAECTDFDDACLAMLAPPVDQAESDKQNAARKLRTRLTGKGKDAGEVPVPSWRALKLQRLGLGKPHHVMDHKTAMRVIEAVGHDLVSLDVSGFKDIKDEFVTVGLHKHCPMLRELTMDECLEITGTGLSQYFAGLREATGRRAGESLERVGLERCYGLTAETVQELVRSAGSSLQALNLNSVDDKMTKWGLMALTGRMYDAEGNLVEETTGCSCLAEIDLSWVRCTTDAVMEEVVRCCPRIATVRVYGCPGVTQFAPSRAGLRYLGRESDTL
ncbi:UV-damaged DNA-binding protein rad7 [Linderina macrospora]|uniref:UV-damaged DNA-binding protein rad7 n=1 Tax=Linderina macrospora TaxID=4868 RepID=A0ACC1J6E1_9FUNG|nr:UV-damaged DNA-binding protein rad7 [Linderina macrospora]